MNEQYITYVKTAHNMCREMLIMDVKSDDYQDKLNEYCSFVNKISETSINVGCYLMRIAIYYNNLPVYYTPEFTKFAEKNAKFICSEKFTLMDRDFLTADLLYLRDIRPD